MARAYITIRALENRLGIARQNVETQAESLRIAKIRYEGGTTSERDVEYVVNTARHPVRVMTQRLAVWAARRRDNSAAD